MTNNEVFNEITGLDESPEEVAVAGLLSKIHEDYENDNFETNYSVYLDWYHAYLDWLKSEKSERTDPKEFT